MRLTTILTPLLACLCGAVFAEGAAAPRRTVVFEDFAEPGAGDAWTYFWGKGATGSIGAGKDPDNAANPVGAFSYAIADTGGYVVLRCGRALEDGVVRVALRARPAENGPQFAARIHDASGETLLFELAKSMDWTGWREFQLDLEHPTTHWGGDNDGIVAFPATLSVQVQSEAAARGAVLLDDIVQTFRVDDSNRFILSAFSELPGNIGFDGVRPEIEVRLEDRLGEAGKYHLEVFCTSAATGEASHESVSLSTAAGEDGAARFRFRPTIGRHFDHWTIRTLLIARDGVLLGRLETMAASVGPRLRGFADSPLFGMNLGLPSRGGSDMEGYARLAAESGVGWTRDDFSWERIEPVKGDFHWDRTDRAVAAAQASGLRTLGLIAYCASWARAIPGEYTSPPRDVRDYADFVYRVVSRYKDRVRHWELWNEPDSPVFWKPKPDAAEFAALLKAGYEAAKRADPDCVVMPAGLLVGMNHWDQWGYLDELFSAGVLGHFDRFAWHAYCDPNSPERGQYAERTRSLVDRLRGHGFTGSVWLTEEGWHTHGVKSPRIVSEEQQADYLVRAHVLALSTPGVETFFWFLFRDGGNREDDPEQSYGILHPDSTPKRAFPAYAAMTRLLRGAKSEGPVPVKGLPIDILAYRFVRLQGGEARTVTILWRPDGQVPARLRAKAILDAYGNPLPRDGEVWNVLIGSSPVYALELEAQ